MKTIFISLGGNLENTQEIFHELYPEIEKNIGIIQKFSSIYQTAAWGLKKQPDFLNQVLKIKSKIDSPQEILRIVLQMEKNSGRVRKEKWGPRLIDIDILFIEDEVIHLNDLIIPHPYIQERNFILIPFKEIEKDFIHPVFNKTIEKLHLETKDKSEVIFKSPPL